MDKTLKSGIIFGILSLVIRIFPFTVIPILIISMLSIVIFIMGGFNALVLGNNEKEGYYAQYGESFGTNADKHDLYIEEQIANEVTKGK